MKLFFTIFILISCKSVFSMSVVVKLADNYQGAVPSTWQKLTRTKLKRFKNVYKVNFPKESKFENIQRSIKKDYDAIYVEDITTFGFRSIIPSEIPYADISDPLLSFQWGTYFNGQKVFNEITDIKEIMLKGSRDIDFSTLSSIEEKFKKEQVVIAVLDTGVDYNHADLKDNIALKEDECEDGKIPFDPPKVEGDPYSGDCKGWSFSGANEEGNNRPDDFVGHGTHIAGIMAASKNNALGISGLSNKIKILPVKILSDEDESSQAIGTSDRLVKGIEYAIARKVDVINLSLGWPLSFDKGHLKDIVQEAIDRGIIVVAAAGNNDHSEPIMPCGYKGVLCVGSSNPDGLLSDFSNFGAHVDVLAPGNKILSTYPNALIPSFFDFNGYEVKSGTSQAAPYVSGLAGILSGLYPDLTPTQIKGKILASAPLNNKKNKFSSRGLISFDQAISKDKRLIRPNFKGFNRVKVNANDLTFSFDVSFEKYNDTFKDTLVKLSCSSDVILDETIKKFSGNKINVSGRFKSIDHDLLQKFKLELVFANQSFDYTFEKRFYLDFKDLKNIRELNITGAIPKSLTQLSTINYYHFPYEKPYYYTFTKSRAGRLFTLFTIKENELKRIGITILKDATDLISVHMIDANLDDKQDIVIRYLTTIEAESEEEEDQNFIVYSYLTEELKPLFKKKINSKEESFSEFKLNFEDVFLSDLSNFSWGKVTFEGVGKMLVPVYLGYTQKLPEADRNPNPFARLRNRSFSSRIYYYVPKVTDDSVEFITRTLNNNKFTDKFKKEIGFKPFQQVFLTKFKTQTYEEIRQGRFDLYFSLESERTLPKNFLFSLESLDPLHWKIEKLSGVAVNFSNLKFMDIFNLEAQKPVRHLLNTKLKAYEKQTNMVFDNFRFKENEIMQGEAKQQDINRPIQVPIREYYGYDKIFEFYLTPSSIFLEMTRPDGSKRRLSHPTHVSSFLPGALFKEQHYPITIKKDALTLPALYTDSTQIASRNIYLLTYMNEELVAPLRFNVNIPENCKALNPIVTDKALFEYSLLCFKDEGKASIIYVPLVVE